MSFWDWLPPSFAAPAPSPPTPPPAPAAYDPVPELEKLLALREGCVLMVYRDSLGKPTVGIGHLVRPEDNLTVGETITQEHCDMLFKADSAGALAAARVQAAQAGITDATFLPALASVCFQMGNAWIRVFPNTWGMICRGEYERAAVALNGTTWNRQTPTRVADFQQALRSLPPKP